MKNPFSGLFRARDKSRDAVSSAPSFYFGTSSSGKSVTPSSAVQASAVYACVRVIAGTIASLPVHVYEVTDNGSRKATEHPPYRLLHDEPNEEMTSFVWRETMLSHLLLRGNITCAKPHFFNRVTHSANNRWRCVMRVERRTARRVVFLLCQQFFEPPIFF